MMLVSGLRALACIAALTVAAMAAPALAAMTDDLSSFEPACDVSYDLAAVSAEGACFSMAIEAIDIDEVLAIAAVLGQPASSPSCSDGPAWMAVDTIEGLIAERLPACNPRRHDPGWRS